jgi:hypothetical protein
MAATPLYLALIPVTYVPPRFPTSPQLLTTSQLLLDKAGQHNPIAYSCLDQDPPWRWGTLFTFRLLNRIPLTFVTDDSYNIRPRHPRALGPVPVLDLWRIRSRIRCRPGHEPRRGTRQ